MTGRQITECGHGLVAAVWRLTLVAVLWAGVLAPGARAQSLVVTSGSDSLQSSLSAVSQALRPPAGANRADIVALAQGDYPRLLAVLYDTGFFGPVISIRLNGREASELSVLSPPDKVGPVEIVVNPGTRFGFGRAEVAPLPPGAELPESFRPGEKAELTAIRAAAAAGVDAWRAASHAKARISDQSIIARHDAAALDVRLTVAPGPALNFGEFVTPNPSAVRRERILAMAGARSGRAFDPDQLRRMRDRLVASGAFRSVVVREAELPNADGTLDIDILTEDAKPRRFGFGAEVFSDEGVSLEAFWMHRNIFGGAERLRFDARVEGIEGNTAGRDYKFGAFLSIPGFRRPDDTLTIGARLESLDQPTFRSEIVSLTLNRERKMNDRLTYVTGIGYRASESTSALGSEVFRHVTLEGRMIRDHRDDKLDPRSGFLADIALMPLLGVAGSASGLHGTADLRAYRALGERTVFAARLQLGTVVGAELGEVPPDLLFLSGGGSTVRGQAFQSLGVETGSGLVGGRSFLGLSGEIRQAIGNGFGLVGFADMGFVGRASDFSNMRDHAGFGFGLRYRTTLGPLRVDLGWAADDPQFDSPNLYIGLGESF